jgi:protein associated with RNAse G/E
VTVQRWEPGDTVVFHEVWRSRVWAARPLTVVEDTEEHLLLWLPHGTLRKVPAPPGGWAGVERDPDGLPTEANHRGVVENLARGRWEHMDHVWEVSTLWILRPGEWCATWVSWLPSGEHLGWYVNLQEPYRRTAAGIAAVDLMLDLVVEPDRRWRWKDQHEFDECIDRGLFDPESANAVRRTAQQAIAAIEAGDDPFTERWTTWAPPAWPVPVLPPTWAEVPAPR